VLVPLRKPEVPVRTGGEVPRPGVGAGNLERGHVLSEDAAGGAEAQDTE
jgi:hypothetical protein